MTSRRPLLFSSSFAIVTPPSSMRLHMAVTCHHVWIPFTRSFRTIARLNWFRVSQSLPGYVYHQASVFHREGAACSDLVTDTVVYSVRSQVCHNRIRAGLPTYLAMHRSTHNLACARSMYILWKPCPEVMGRHQCVTVMS